MTNTEIIDKLLDLINVIEEARRTALSVADAVNTEDSNIEVSELLETVDDQLDGAVDAIDTAVRLLDVE